MRVLALAAVVSIVLLACAPATPSPAASVVQPAAPEPTTQTRPSPVATPTIDASPPPSIDPIGDVQCEGGATSGSSDYPADPGGGLPDLEQATRALPGVLPSDEVLIDAERSAVRRDGRVIFIGWWFESSTGGWRLSTFVNCGDSGIGID